MLILIIFFIRLGRSLLFFIFRLRLIFDGSFMLLLSLLSIFRVLNFLGRFWGTILIRRRLYRLDRGGCFHDCGSLLFRLFLLYLWLRLGGSFFLLDLFRGFLLEMLMEVNRSDAVLLFINCVAIGEPMSFVIIPVRLRLEPQFVTFLRIPVVEREDNEEYDENYDERYHNN
jgi:hypothetical protein